jgi:hypothetical protein
MMMERPTVAIRDISLAGEQQAKLLWEIMELEIEYSGAATRFYNAASICGLVGRLCVCGDAKVVDLPAA